MHGCSYFTWSHGGLTAFQLDLLIPKFSSTLSLFSFSRSFHTSTLGRYKAEWNTVPARLLEPGLAQQSGRAVQDCPKGQFQWMSLPTRNLIFRSDAAQVVSAIRTSWLGKCFCGLVVTGFRGAIADGAQVMSLLLWGIQRGGALPGTDHDTFFHGILNGWFWEAHWYFMLNIYACIYQWSVPVEHGLKNPQRSPELILVIASIQPFIFCMSWLGWAWRTWEQRRLLNTEMN